MGQLSKVVITGGGTGGHFYPALAVAQEIRRRNENADILFIGSQRGIEAKAAPAAGFPVQFISSAGFSGSPGKLFSFFTRNPVGLMQALSILKKSRPDIVIGSGGFVSFPVLLAAKLMNIPFVILEQNVLPGKVNRLMAKWSEKVLASFEASKKYLPSSKTIITGNPIRHEIVQRTREEGMKNLNLSKDYLTLVITGASQGARSINNAVLKSLSAWKDKGWQIIHLVGRNNYEEMKRATEEYISDFREEYRCIDYTEDMASVYAATDLVVARSGASTLAEITARGLPAILVPYPYAADNHQEKNARWIEEVGGAKVIPDDRVEGDLSSVVIELACDRTKLCEMSEKSRSLGRPDALSLIVDEIESVLSRKT
jgi:UDP-N-acetylglucosamine--N-acetylmuramyl-(pentapeptide) pyrophosphoryl-undecaprenol N-acetylglucosamine transferase